jgi:hypothetical protein
MDIVMIDDRQIEVVDEKMAEILRRKTPAERLMIGFGLWRSTVRLLSFYIKSAHPEWGEPTVQAEVARRMSNGAR